MAGRWRDISPSELRDMLAHVDAMWALAGGYALEAAFPGTTREHSDIEIACFRDELPSLLRQLSGFEIAIARNKQLTPFDPGSSLPEPPFNLWLRRHGETIWDFEILVEDRAGDDWIYRRAPEIHRPIAGVFVPEPGAPGRLLIAPEVQLLYKAKAPREKDIWDFRTYWPQLDVAARDWLRHTIGQVHPEFAPELARIDDGR